jgi:hypothetical protein
MKTRDDAAQDAADDRAPLCTYRAISVADALLNVFEGRWDVPTFQRPFVWRRHQVCALADSLWRGYPVGLILLWRPARNARGAESPRLWIADGQQRLTSLCLLAGAAPPWTFAGEGRAGGAQDDIKFYFDVDAVSAPRFVALPCGKSVAARAPMIDCAELLAIDLTCDEGRTRLARLIARLRPEGSLAPDEELLRRLTRVCMIRTQPLLVAELECARVDEVLEVFRRLNSRGMRYRHLLLKLVMGAIGTGRRYASVLKF